MTLDVNDDVRPTPVGMILILILVLTLTCRDSL